MEAGLDRGRVEPNGGGFISGLDLLKIYSFLSPFTFVLGWPKFQQLDVATGLCGLHHVGLHKHT
jgi:hypothetical protein